MYERILVPLDGSEIAEKALPIAYTIAKGDNAQVILLRVNEYPLNIYTGAVLFTRLDPKIMEKIKSKESAIFHKNADYLNRIFSRMEESGLQGKAEIKDGPVVECILDTIVQEEIDLVIMSAHGVGEGSACSIGSVADRVLRESTIPLILVRQAQMPESANNHSSTFSLNPVLLNFE